MDIFHPNRFIFWGSEWGIGRAFGEDGSHVDTTAIWPVGSFGTQGMAWSVYDNRLFWPVNYCSPYDCDGEIRRSPRDGTPVKIVVGGDAGHPLGMAVDGLGPVASAPTAVKAARRRLRTAIRRGVRARLRAPGSGRVCAEIRLRARTARRLGLRPKRSERRRGKLLAPRRCVKTTTPRARKLTVRFGRRPKRALRKLVRACKGLTVRLRVVWTDALGYRHPTGRRVRLAR